MWIGDAGCPDDGVCYTAPLLCRDRAISLRAAARPRSADPVCGYWLRSRLARRRC